MHSDQSFLLSFNLILSSVFLDWLEYLAQFQRFTITYFYFLKKVIAIY